MQRRSLIETAAAAATKLCTTTLLIMISICYLCIGLALKRSCSCWLALGMMPAKWHFGCWDCNWAHRNPVAMIGFAVAEYAYMSVVHLRCDHSVYDGDPHSYQNDIV
jgi:hypothetical protein